MGLKTALCVIVFSFIFDLAFAQGDENLLLQYRKGPDIARYRKWNFDLHLRGVRIGPNGDYTTPKIGYALGGNIQYKYSKSIGASTGVGLLSLNYQYNLKNNSTYDNLNYLFFPITIRVFPTQRTHFETGFLYHHLIKAKNSAIVDLEQKSNFYPDNVFKNTFGWLFAVNYNIWKKFHISVEYRFFKKSTLTNYIQKNNFNGFLLGIRFLILNPNKIGP
tara:strand:- start:754 stop:1410 length:657 start_codon:yes stop_codon:yes gene_type:complete